MPDLPQNPSPVQRSIRVRQAILEDAPRITALDAEQTGVVKPGHFRRMLAECRPPQGVSLVAEREGELLGYVLGEVRAWEFGSPPTGWILAVAVAPECRGEGLGAKLVSEACRALSATGAKAVRTMVDRRSVEMLRFFRGAGFVAGPFMEMEVPCVPTA